VNPLTDNKSSSSDSVDMATESAIASMVALLAASRSMFPPEPAAVVRLLLLA